MSMRFVDGRGDAPGTRWLVGGEQAGEHRDQRGARGRRPRPAGRSRSGIRKAAKNESSSRDAPKVVPITTTRTQPSDPREQERRGDDEARSREGAPRGHRGGRARAAPIAGARGGARRGTRPQAGRRHVRVDLRGGEALVAEQLLDDAQVRAALQEVRREAVAEGVRRDPDGQARGARRRSSRNRRPRTPSGAPRWFRNTRPGRSRRRRTRRPACDAAAARPAILAGRRRARAGPAARGARCAPCGPCPRTRISPRRRSSAAERGRGQLADAEARRVRRLDEGPVSRARAQPTVARRPGARPVVHAASIRSTWSTSRTRGRRRGWRGVAIDGPRVPGSQCPPVSRTGRTTGCAASRWATDASCVALAQIGEVGAQGRRGPGARQSTAARLRATSRYAPTAVA